MSDVPTLANILKISGLCLRACFGFAGAWIFWRMAVPGFEAFALFAVIWAIGGAICAGKALVELIRMLLRMRKMNAFARKGSDPKADPVAKTDDLRAKGLIE
ncbi:MAG: hypothetical protein AAF354_12930 [Pseudomonadota bacterium]